MYINWDMRTLIDGQVRLLFAHDVVFLLFLHVCAFIVGLVQDELVGTGSTGKGILSLRTLSRGCRPSDGETVAAVWANYIVVNLILYVLRSSYMLETSRRS